MPANDRTYAPEKRQFGRRQSDIRGSSIVANAQPKPFVIQDLSEGGALLLFDDPDFVPDKSFRILIETTTMILLCEVRHRSRSGIGVRFMRPAEGAELNRYFLTKPVEVASRHGAELPKRPPVQSQAVRGQDLRASLHLVHSAAERESEAAAQQSTGERRSALATSLLRIRNAIAPGKSRPDAAPMSQGPDEDVSRR